VVSGACLESVSNAPISAAGSSLPRFAARRKMPAAARGDRKNLAGAVGSSTSARVTRGQDEYSPSSLRHAEIASVEDSVSHAIPEFGKPPEKDGEISSAVGGEETGNVLQEDPRRSVSFHKLEVGEGEAGASAVESSSLAGDAEVLAGEAAGPEDSTASASEAVTGPVSP
jgi:hypothetical protein